MDFVNPYADCRGPWLRGSFHGHCSESSPCGTVALADGIARYAAAGADFVTLTDHDRVTDLSAAARRHPGLVFLHGFEHSRAEHLLFIGERVPPLHELPLPDAMARAGGLLTVLAHPEPEARPYWTLEKIRALGRIPDGIEIYDGHYGVPRLAALGRRPRYTHVWDALLAAGIRLWGFADDDFHDPEDFGNAFNMVCATERSARGIVDAARRGRFYASTGLRLASVAVRGSRMEVALAEEGVGRFIGPGGTVLRESTGRRFAYDAGNAPHVRFEADGPTGSLWLQPWIKAEPGSRR